MPKEHLSLSMVRIERAAGVATLTMDRPDQLNAVSPVLVQQLQWAFDDVSADPEVQGIVFAGAGKVFTVGADIGFIVRNLEAGDYARIMSVTYAAHTLFDAVAASAKPVVARVHAPAFGAGVELALACHRIVATPQANFCLPEAGLGIFPCLGGTSRSARRIGTGLAKWFIYTGKTLSAGDALKIGFADDLVPADALDEACRGHALGRLPSRRPAALPADFARLAAFFDGHAAEDLRAGIADAGGDPSLARAMKSVGNKAPISLRFVERIIDDGARQTLAAALQMEIDSVLEIYHTADARTGLVYRTKKQIGAPVFEGK